MSFLIFSFILLLVIIFLLVILSCVWPPDSPWAPWWNVSRKKARLMCKLANVSEKDIVYDLGSGTGTSLIIAAKEFGAKGVGIEIDPLRFLISKILVSLLNLSKKVEIKRGNFFSFDLSRADVVFLYLVPKTLEKLKPKLLSELKKGTRIVTVTYKIPGGIQRPLIEKETLGFRKSISLYNPLRGDKREIHIYTV